MEANKVVLAVIMVSFALIIGVYITSTLSTTFKTDQSGTAVNETGSLLSTGYTLTQSTLSDFVPSIVTVTNATSGAIIPAANYSLRGNQIYNGTAQTYGLGQVNITYTYTYKSSTSTSNASDNATTALNGGLSWLTIVVVVGFAVIVLVLLNKGLGSSATGYESGGEVYEMQPF